MQVVEVNTSAEICMVAEIEAGAIDIENGRVVGVERRVRYSVNSKSYYLGDKMMKQSCVLENPQKSIDFDRHHLKVNRDLIFYFYNVLQNQKMIYFDMKGFTEILRCQNY